MAVGVGLIQVKLDFLAHTLAMLMRLHNPE